MTINKSTYDEMAPKLDAFLSDNPPPLPSPVAQEAEEVIVKDEDKKCQ